MTVYTPDATPALTRLAEDEILFRDSVYEFADREIRPLVREMDEQAKIPRSLIDKLFALGVMGIEVPETFGGGGASFFHAVLAVEALSRVDPSIGVLVDVQNTLVINAVARWGSDDIKRRYLTKLSSATVGAYCLSEAGSGSDAFALQTRAVESGRRVSTERAKTLDHQRQRSRCVPGVCHAQSGRRLSRHHRVHCRAGRLGFTVGKKEDKLGIRASSTCELLFEDCVVGRDSVVGDVVKATKSRSRR